VRQTSILEVNEFLVLDFVRARGETSRPEIADELGLSASSISRIIRRLIVGGLVTEGSRTSTGGRPRTAIAFNSRAGCVLGVDLGGSTCHGAVADLAGTIVDEVVRPTARDGGPYPTLVGVIDELVAIATMNGLPVAAIAVGAPAIIDADTGVATGGPNVDWHGFPLVAELGRHVNAPLIVQNDVRLAALAHAWRGDGRRCSDFAVLSIGTGIGAAIVVDGRLARGRHNAAGEVGYLVLARDQLGQQADERVDQRAAAALGGFERLAAGPSIAASAAERFAAERFAADGSGRLPEASALTTAGVFAAAAGGDPIALAIIDEVVDHVAMAIVAIGAIADPEIVILEGSVGRALGPFLKRLTERVASQLPAPPRVVASGLGSNATVVGAVAAALQLARTRGAPVELSSAFIVTGGAAPRRTTADVA
jgi:glucokinase